MNYDVIIIGAGPGGIFAAYELMKEKPDYKAVSYTHLRAHAVSYTHLRAHETPD